MREDALLTGKLEPTNEPYAISKLLVLSFAKATTASTVLARKMTMGLTTEV